MRACGHEGVWARASQEMLPHDTGLLGLWARPHPRFAYMPPDLQMAALSTTLHMVKGMITSGRMGAWYTPLPQQRTTLC